MRIVDTFAGIGGFRLAAEHACKRIGMGCECVLSVEIDAAARATYKSNFADLPLEDMTKISADDVPLHDLLLGGFPCQPFSRNGKFYNKNNRTLGDDDRANLCYTLFDILNAKRPARFIFENVKELKVIRNKDGTLFFDTILENLRGCGYSVKHAVLNSSDFGLAQQRKRVYIVGMRDDLGVPQDIPLSTIHTGIRAIEEVLEKSPPQMLLLEHLWRKRKNLRTISGIVDNLLDKGIKKPNFERLLRDALAVGGDRHLGRLETLRLAYEGGDWKEPLIRTGNIEPIAIIYGETISGLPRQQDKLYSIKGISPTIATFSTPPVNAPEGWRILTPRECARLQGFPESFKLHERSNYAYKQIGNAVSTSVAQEVIFSQLEKA